MREAQMEASTGRARGGRTMTARTKEVPMKRAWYAMVIVSIMLAACGSDGGSQPAEDGGEGSNAARASAADDPIDPLTGTWHTQFTCRQMVAALEEADVARLAPGIVQDEFGVEQRPTQKDPCANVSGTADHTLRFEDGQFALFAGDELGWEASYEIVDDDTFVTAAPDVMTFDFRIESDKLYTHIVEPAKQAPFIATWESAPWERED
jgi:hypothetical protein